MKLDMDCIQFESRYEIGEIIHALEEWEKGHQKDNKTETVKRMIALLDVMNMTW